MKVSVLMPMKNAALYVQLAVASVLQTISVPVELIVIDDGSTDGSRKLLESITDSRLKIIDGPQQGIAACMNVGLSHVTGTLIMRCDADDIFPADRIEFQSKWLEANPEYIAICGGFEMINGLGESIAMPFDSTNDDGIDISNELRHGVLRTSLCTFCIRQEVFHQLNGFRTYFETSEDIDFAFRLSPLGKIMFLKKNFYQYRIHGTSVTHTLASQRRVFFDEIAKLFSHQRLETGTDDLLTGHPPMPLDNIGNINSARKHTLELMVGNIWQKYKLNHHKEAIKICFKLLQSFPTKSIAWVTTIKIVTKIIIHLSLRPTRKRH